MSEQHVQRADAVFEGGGVKGVGLVGALQAFEEAGFEWQNVAGTSAGAITAALVAVGYSAAEINDIMNNRINFRQMMDRSGVGLVPVVGPWLSMLFNKGMYQGNYVLNTMRELFTEKTGRETLKFGDLVVPPEPGDVPGEYEEKYKYKLRVIASDISNNSMFVLPQAVKRLGMDPDELEVAVAVRMSISFPFFFRPVTLPEADNPRRKHYFVDGGMLSNFPIWLFDSAPGVVPSWPTIGMLLTEPGTDQEPYQPISGPISMIRAMVRTMTSAHDRKALDEIDKKRIVRIPTGHVSTLDFDLSKADRDWLFRSGFEAAQKFLAEFSFEEYKEQREEQVEREEASESR